MGEGLLHGALRDRKARGKSGKKRVWLTLTHRVPKKRGRMGKGDPRVQQEREDCWERGTPRITFSLAQFPIAALKREKKKNWTVRRSRRSEQVTTPVAGGILVDQKRSLEGRGKEDLTQERYGVGKISPPVVSSVPGNDIGRKDG